MVELANTVLKLGQNARRGTQFRLRWRILFSGSLVFVDHVDVVVEGIEGLLIDPW